MTNVRAFFTLKQAAIAEFIERKSRFIGQATPCETEEEALSFVKLIKEQHKTATHHCYAYVLGSNAGLMRYQDDGEPQGTAGIPILEVIKKNQLVNCCVVVTRYYGGVQLGAGGLVRAYSKAAALCVKQAFPVLSEPSCRMEAKVSYAHWDKLNYALERLPVDEVEKIFSDLVDISMVVRMKDVDKVREEIMNLTDGETDCSQSDPFQHLWPAEEVQISES